MRRAFLSFLIMLMSFTVSYSQAVISGRVLNAKNKEPEAGVNVIFRTVDGKGMCGFRITDANGAYSFEVNNDSDSLLITLSGFNVKGMSRVVPTNVGRMDFYVEHEELNLKEVVVKASPIGRKGDTLTYMVSSFIDTLKDRSIGDVLKKMPGIDVAKNGQITYNGREINKFYIEGLDLMGGRYGLATNNVRAKDVAAVNVYENHQPIRALKGIIIPDEAAINLKLKPSAKGSLIGILDVGGGYKPWMWSGDALLMRFASKWQTMTSYKTNNAGIDITSELDSFYDKLYMQNSILSVHMPDTPFTDQERYMDNTTHAASINNIFKLSESADNTMNVNGAYIHDRQKFNSSSLTTYYLPQGELPLEIDETTSAINSSDRMEVKLKYNLNDEKIYMKDQVAFGAKWDDNAGWVLYGSDVIGQAFRMRQYVLQNDFSFLKVLGNGLRINFSSRTEAANYPSNLRVTPLIYPEIFGYDSGMAFQDMTNKKISTDNNIFIHAPLGKGFTLFTSAGFTIDNQNMTSSLLSADDVTAPDSLRNYYIYRRFDIRGNVGLYWDLDDQQVSIGMNPDYVNMWAHDRVLSSTLRKDRMFFNPNFQISGKIAQNLKYSLSGNLIHNLGAASGIYRGYIMTDYRQIGSRDGEIAQTRYETAKAQLSYGNALKAVFGSLSANIWKNHSNMMYGTEYVGSLSRVKVFGIGNDSHGWGTSGKVEKRFYDISTSVGLSAGYRQSWLDVLRQGNIMKVRTESIPLELTLSARFAKNIFLDYAISYARSRSVIKGQEGDTDPINSLSQKMDLTATLFKKVIFTATGEHFFNDAVSSGDRSMFFLDARLSFKARAIEYSIECRNLLDASSYNYRVYNDITNYQSSYSLRPASILFKIRFSLK
ncbi:MAG: hypothetical protein PUK70_07915 [Bacteroidales bacterium]|nr:hypothetical protein [Bacteroidales bacterium]